MTNHVEDKVLGMLDGRQRFLRRKMPLFKVEKRNKYGAKKCKIDGYTFDSLKEGKEYGHLKLELLAGDIKDLKIHPSYPIFINDKLVCKVELDFEYYDNRRKKIRYIDVKGFETDISKLKKKMIEAQLGIEAEWI